MQKLNLSLNKQSFKSEEMVSGRVILSISHPLYIDCLQIKIVKNQKINICQNTESDRDVIKFNKNDGFSHKDILINQIEMRSGRHIFPFKISLNKDCGGSSYFKLHSTDISIEFENKYSIVAEFIHEGKTCRAEIPLTLYNLQCHRIVSEFNLKLKSFLCLLVHSYPYIIRFDKEIYNTGDIIKVECTPEGKMNSRIINMICVEFCETIILDFESVAISKNKKLLEYTGKLTGKNKFNMTIKIPGNIGGSVTEKNVFVQYFLLFKIYTRGGSKETIKKIVNIRQPSLFIPNIDEYMVFGDKEYPEKILWLP